MNFIADPTLVLYLPLYELDGASFASKDAYGHLGTVTGALWTPRGRSFDGSDDEIGCGSGSSLNTLTGVTWEVWIKPIGWGEGNYGRVAEKANGIRIYLLKGAALEAIGFNVYIGGGWKTASTPDGSIVLGNWYHIVGTYDKVKVRCYIDAVVTDGTADTNNLDDHSGAVLLIGDRADSSKCFDGIIGEFRVYNRALTPLEIQHNYLATKWRYK